jgi:hypothetical protein
MSEKEDISNVSIDMTPRINETSPFEFNNEKKIRKSKFNSFSSDKTIASFSEKHVNFAKIEIIRIENYKKYNKTIKYNYNRDKDEKKCKIF